MEESKYPLERKWSIWEMWEQNTRDTSRNWTESMQEVGSFDDLLSFWHAWKHLPHANPTQLFSGNKHSKICVHDPVKGNISIEAIGVFQFNVKPAWEDPANATGSDLSMKLNSSINLKEVWDTLVMSMIGETLPRSNCTAIGCRIVDKKTYYKVEIWLSLDAKKDENLYLKEEFTKWITDHLLPSNYSCELAVNSHKDK